MLSQGCILFMSEGNMALFIFTSAGTLEMFYMQFDSISDMQVLKIWFPIALKIQTESQRCGEAPQSSSLAPVSIGEAKTEVTIYIPFFSKAGELWRVSVSPYAAENKFKRNQVLF